MVNAKYRRYYSLKAKVASVEIILTVTTCYFHKTLKGLHLLIFVFYKQQIMKSFQMLLRLQTAGTLNFLVRIRKFGKMSPRHRWT